MKKIICAALISCLLLAAVPATAQENTYDTYDEMQALCESGIIKGDAEGNLHPNNELTRAEFAAILCRAIGVDQVAETAEMADKGYFDDVPSTHWAAGYVNTAVETGAINGFDDGLFHPEFTVTNEQVIKMLVAAWGYTEEAEDLGGYPNGYMEIAKRHGVTDTVLFSYGIASKRWVACAFVYGALSMPANEDAAVSLPPQLDPIEVKAARPENTGYIEDPISILKRVTPESAKYERRGFEQLVPDGMCPFMLLGDKVVFSAQADTQNVRLYVSDGISKEPLADGYFEGDSYDLANLPAGTWKCQLIITDGPVKDTYHATLEVDSMGLHFSGNIFRYTTLNAQPAFTEVRHELSFSDTSDSALVPFIFEPLLENGWVLALNVSYPFVLEEDFRFVVNMNTADPARELYSLPMHIEGVPHFSYDVIQGENSIVKPVTIFEIEFGVQYFLQVSVAHRYGDDTALSGMIQFFESGGAPGYLFEGVIRTLTIDGFEISDYTY